MKKLLIFTIILSSLFACHKGETEQAFDLDCNFTESFRQEYLADAAKVYHDYLYEKLAGTNADVQFSPYEIERRICELSAIKNWENPLSDTLFDQLNITATCDEKDLKELTVSFAESAFPNLNPFSSHFGHAALDQLISQHNILFTGEETTNGIVYITMASSNAINTTELARLFLEVAGIDTAAPTHPCDLSTKIQIKTKTDDYVSYLFSYDVGNCPDNCVYRTWEIRVNEDYGVTLRKTTGPSIP